jgi:plasmid segregation protein ParM
VAENALKTVNTKTLPKGTLFVSPDDVIYQVVMAGSAGFRKAEPWPWPPRGRPASDRSAVALVPGSLLARNYPVVTEGRPLPVVTRAEFIDSDDRPDHYVFPNEELAKLAAQLDEALAHQSGLGVRKERLCWTLSDGRRNFRVYYYQVDNIGQTLNLDAHLVEANVKTKPCEEGPYYWQYLPGWKESLSAPMEVEKPALEPAIETAMAKALEAAPEPVAPPALEELSFAPTPEPAAPPPVEELEEPLIAEPPPFIPAPEPEPIAPPVAKEPEFQPVAPAPEEPEEQPAPEPAEVAPAKRPRPAPAPVKEETRIPSKRTSRKTARKTPMILSVDIGYGYTKGVGHDGLRFSFPSVIGTAEDIRFATDLIHGEEEQAVKFGDWRFYYGKQAMLQSRVQSAIFDRSRVYDNTYRMLFIAALVELARLVPDANRFRIVTGLPVGFFGDRHQVVEALKGIYQVTVERVMEFTVESVVVTPQPFGSLFRELLNDQGKITNSEVEKGRVGIIDVGTYTTDFVAADELRYVPRLSGSIRIGWSKVIHQVQQALGDLHRLELTPHEVDQALQAGEVRMRGESLSLEPFTRTAIAEIETAIIARARDLWGAGARLDTILVSGGGGPHLFDMIHAVYPHARLLDDAFWANAEGFYRFGQRPATFN